MTRKLDLPDTGHVSDEGVLDGAEGGGGGGGNPPTSVSIDNAYHFESDGTIALYLDFSPSGADVDPDDITVAQSQTQNGSYTFIDPMTVDEFNRASGTRVTIVIGNPLNPYSYRWVKAWINNVESAFPVQLVDVL